MFLSLSIIFTLATGCKKSDLNNPPAVAVSTQPPQNSQAAAFHWIGMKRVASDPNAAGFLKICQLPESEKLKTQTLDKLALAPWSLSGTNPPSTNYTALLHENPSAQLLRLLLDDLVQEEWYASIKDQTEKQPQLALAVRLDPAHASMWETNLAGLIESVTSKSPVHSADASIGWEVQVTNPAPALSPLLRHVQFLRSGDWTFLGFAPGQNSALEDVLTRFRREKTPLEAPATGAWFQTSLDLRRLSNAFSWGWDLPQDWPRLLLSITGDGKQVVTRGSLNFPKPLPFAIEPWSVPTNLIHEPLHSFTAAQGLRPWLSEWEPWKNLKVGPAPNQVFIWAQGSSPFLDYAAAPVADAGKVMTALGPAIMNAFNPLLSSNRVGKWERATNSDGIVWNAPIISPLIQSLNLPEGHFIFSALSPLAVSSKGTPSGTFNELLRQPNTVYFEREITGPRVEAWIYISQLGRIILRREQLSTGPVTSWLKAVGPLLGPSATTITKTGPSELSLSRTSFIGLSGAEIHLLSDWLESSQFPLRLHSQVAKLPPFPSRHSGTSIAPPQRR